MTSASPDTTSASAWRKVVVWAALPLAIGALNDVGLAVALPSLRNEFLLSISDARWMLLAFVIADAAVLIVAGRCGDRFGRLRVAMVGLTAVVVGSLMCAVAPAFWVLLVGRVIEGVGVGIVFAGLLAIISDVVPRESLGRAFGLWAVLGAIAILVSPVAAGALAEHASWRWILVLNAVIALVALVTARRVLPPMPPGGAPLSSRRSSLFKIPNYLAGTFFVALVYLAVALTWLPIAFYLSDVSGLGATLVGLMFVAYAFWWLVLPAFTGRLADRIGRRRPMMMGAIVAAVGYVVLAVTSHNTMMLALGLSLLGIGVAFALPAANAATMGQVPADARGDASGVNMTARMIGTVVGLAVSGALLTGGNDAVATGAPKAWAVAAVVAVVALVISVFAIREVGNATLSSSSRP